jgi:non-homologous end joining protein Ku
MGNAYRKGLTLSLGLISAQVDLHTVAPKSKTGLNRLCPEHTVKLKQKYECPGTSAAEAHDVPWGSWVMGVDTGDGFKVVNEEERPTIEAAGGFTLVPVPRTDLEASTFEGDGIYYVAPNTEHSDQAWAILNRVVQEGEVALITKGAMRKGPTEKIWRLSSFNGYLVLREIRFPEEIKPSPEAPEVPIDDTQYALVQQFLGGLTTAWEDFDSSNAMAARMQEWLGTGTDVAAESAAPAPQAPDIFAALKASLEE